VRDPSHVRALVAEELLSLGEPTTAAPGLGSARVRRFGLPVLLEDQIAASFPNPGGADRLRALFAEDAGSGADRLAFNARRDPDGRLVITYPIMTIAWTKPPIANAAA